MIRLYLLRHGETVWNAESRIQGHLDVKLNEKGKMQAQLAGRRLMTAQLDAVYASDLRRAWETAELAVQDRNLKVTRTPLLREARLGEWEGRTAAELADLFPNELASYREDPTENRPPGGERLEEVILRCREFLDTVADTHKQANILIVAHGGSIRGIICAAFGLPPQFYQRIRLDNAGLTIVDLNDEGPVLVGLNDISHLRDGDGNNLQEY